MKYTLENFIEDIKMMAEIDYKDRKSISRCNKVNIRAGHFWSHKVATWDESFLTQFESLVYNDHPYVSSYVIEVLLMEKPMPREKVEYYVDMFEENIKKMSGGVLLDARMWIYCYEKGMIHAVNPYPERNETTK